MGWVMSFMIPCHLLQLILMYITHRRMNTYRSEQRCSYYSFIHVHSPYLSPCMTRTHSHLPIHNPIRIPIHNFLVFLHQRHISYWLPLLTLSPPALLGLPPMPISSAGTAKNPPNPFPTTTLFLAPPPTPPHPLVPSSNPEELTGRNAVALPRRPEVPGCTEENDHSISSRPLEKTCNGERRPRWECELGFESCGRKGLLELRRLGCERSEEPVE